MIIAALVSLCGCGGGATLGQLPEWAGGLPENAPAHPAETLPYPNVYEPRPTRETKPLTAEEQKRLESELSNLRDAQNKRANPPPTPEPKSPGKAATKATTRTASKAPAKEALKERPKGEAKAAPKKKVADKPKPKPPEKKPADTLVPEPKAPSDLKLMN